MFFGFAIVATAVMMLTSQMPEAYAADETCNDKTFTDDITGKLCQCDSLVTLNETVIIN